MVFVDRHGKSCQAGRDLFGDSGFELTGNEPGEAFGGSIGDRQQAAVIAGEDPPAVFESGGDFVVFFDNDDL